MKNLLLLLLQASVTFSLERGNGDRVDSFPSYYERQLISLTDACRMAPTQYRDRFVGNYQVLLPQNYPPVKPLYWNLALNESSRAQGIDMADNCGLQHNSCNGTDFATRIESYYLNKSFTLGENIACGYTTAAATLTQWILEVDPTTTPVPADLSGSDGHRKNIMGAQYFEMGAGYAYGPVQWYYFWVQDFGGGIPTFTDPLVSGSHFFFTTDSITFFVNYYDSAVAPSAMTCTIAGQPFPMTLIMGTARAGTWGLTQKKGTSNRHYVFSCTRSGVSYRYPEYGVLVSAGEGAGIDDYIPPESLAVVNSRVASMSPNRVQFAWLEGKGLTISGLRGENIEKITIFDSMGFRGSKMKGLVDGSVTLAWNTKRIRPGIMIGRVTNADGKEWADTFVIR